MSWKIPFPLGHPSPGEIPGVNEIVRKSQIAPNVGIIFHFKTMSWFGIELRH
jgi:hypothetical protein